MEEREVTQTAPTPWREERRVLRMERKMSRMEPRRLEREEVMPVIIISVFFFPSFFVCFFFSRNGWVRLLDCAFVLWGSW